MSRIAFLSKTKPNSNRPTKLINPDCPVSLTLSQFHKRNFLIEFLPAGLHHLSDLVPVPWAAAINIEY